MARAITGAERRALERPLQATASATASSRSRIPSEEGGGAQSKQLDEKQGREAKQNTSRSVEVDKEEPFLKLEKRQSSSESGERSRPRLPTAEEEPTGQESGGDADSSWGSHAFELSETVSRNRWDWRRQ